MKRGGKKGQPGGVKRDDYYDSSSDSGSASSGDSSSDEDDMTFEQKLSAKKNGRSRDARTMLSRDGTDGRTKKRDEKRDDATKKKKSKNRPAEMSSTRQVSRYRDVVEGAGIKFRDPRFDNMSGSINHGHFETAYSFLDQYKEDEISALRKQRDDLDKIVNSDSTGRAAYARERIIGQMNRLRNELDNKRRMDKKNTLKRKLRKQEREQVKTGKNPFFLKKSVLRKEELKEKYEELEKKGGLKKYMAKRRKKNSSKDRKALPWFPTGRDEE